MTFNGKRGFTFLELTIALAIISIAFVSLISLFNTSLGVSDYSNKVTKATFLAQKIMIEAELKGGYDYLSGEEVKLEDEYEGYSYKFKANDTLIPFVKEVTLTVYFESVLKRHSLRVTTCIIGNEIGGSDEISEEI